MRVSARDSCMNFEFNIGIVIIVVSAIASKPKSIYNVLKYSNQKFEFTVQHNDNDIEKVVSTEFDIALFFN